MYNGIEIDMLSLGDADSILVTEWTPQYGPGRVLIDGGKGSDAEIVKGFLHSRKLTTLWAVVCTHLHNDHAKGLIKVVQDKTISIQNAWMHDIRKHLSADTLRRASAGNSSQADNVRQVVENTKELASAFASRNLAPKEPFAGQNIAGFPWMNVLAPSLPFYRRVLQDFTEEVVPSLPPSLLSLSAVLAGSAPMAAAVPGAMPSLSLHSSLFAPPPPSNPYTPLGFSTLAGMLKNSSVKENPTTQPFNDSSVILGVVFNGAKLMLTGDAGSDALGQVPAEWNHLNWMQVPHHGSDGNLSQSDIERFCPQFANISACGDDSHPSRAIVSGLVKVGTKVFSAHKSGNLRFFIGNVLHRSDYSSIEPLKGTGGPDPIPSWSRLSRS